MSTILAAIEWKDVFPLLAILVSILCSTAIAVWTISVRFSRLSDSIGSARMDLTDRIEGVRNDLTNKIHQGHVCQAKECERLNGEIHALETLVEKNEEQLAENKGYVLDMRHRVSNLESFIGAKGN